MKNRPPQTPYPHIPVFVICTYGLKSLKRDTGTGGSCDLAVGLKQPPYLPETYNPHFASRWWWRWTLAFSGGRTLAKSDRRRLGGGGRQVLVFSGGRMLAKMEPRKAGLLV